MSRNDVHSTDRSLCPGYKAVHMHARPGDNLTKSFSFFYKLSWVVPVSLVWYEHWTGHTKRLNWNHKSRFRWKIYVLLHKNQLIAGSLVPASKIRCIFNVLDVHGKDNVLRDSNFIGKLHNSIIIRSHVSNNFELIWKQCNIKALINLSLLICSVFFSSSIFQSESLCNLNDIENKWKEMRTETDPETFRSRWEIEQTSFMHSQHSCLCVICIYISVWGAVVLGTPVCRSIFLTESTFIFLFSPCGSHIAFKFN